MEEKLVCPICGEPTSVYMGNARKDRLCRKHAKELKEGNIYFCDDCEQYHAVNTICPNKHMNNINKGNIDRKCVICGESTKDGWKYLCLDCYKKCLNYTDELKDKFKEHSYNKLYNGIKEFSKKQNDLNLKQDRCIYLTALAKAYDRYFNNKELLNIVEDDIKDIISIQSTTREQLEEKQPQNSSKKCLLCDNDSGQYMFCKSCFSQYRNKTLLLKVTVDNNQKIELLNESYEGIYVCKDGHVVKSKSERDIDNYLFEHKIAHAYEKALPIKGEIFKPDFYLPDLDVYIEHWGYDETNIEYTQRKEYKIAKYKEKGITLICTYEATDMKDVETSLEIKLDSYEKGKINFL